MFCPIVKLDLKVNSCPARDCMYKAAGGGCSYEKLTADEVTLQDVAEAKAVKLYKAKAITAAAKVEIETGIIAMRYAEYVAESYPNLSRASPPLTSQTVNEGKDTTRNVLKNLFGLSEYQQEKYLCSTRYAAWANRHTINLKFSDLWASLQRAGLNYCV